MDTTIDPGPTTREDGERTPDRLGTLSVALGVAGLLPVLPLLGSIGAIVCGLVARGRSDAPSSERDRGLAGIVLGAVGVLAPLVALFVYCVVLGYPFPIHRYRG